MARTLKSDKMLFLADAAARRRERRHGVQRVGRAGARRVPARRTTSWSSSSSGRVIGLALHARRDAHRLPPATGGRRSSGRCSASTVVALARGVLSSRRATARSAGSSLGGVSVQPSELAKLVADPLHGGAARAADAPRQRRRLRARADRRRRRSCWPVSSCSSRTSARPSMLVARRRRDGVRRRPELPLSVRRGCSCCCRRRWC